MSRARNNNGEHVYSQSAIQDDEDDGGQLTPLSHPQADYPGSFFSRFKQTITGSSLGNLLGQNNTTPTPIAARNSRTLNIRTSLDDSPIVTPRRLSIVRNVFTPLPGSTSSRSRSNSASSMSSDASPTSASSFNSPDCFSPMSLSSQPTLATSVNDSDADDKWSPTLTSSSEAQSTPPFTPDIVSVFNASVQGEIPASAYSQSTSLRSTSDSAQHRDKTNCCLGVKKGKHPAPPFPYDALLEDISNVNISAADQPAMQAMSGNGDEGEWWGLAYTLELSRKDSRVSDTSSSITGEHSKSRESWAAIHQGTILPINEDANFQDWKRWHRALEKIELRRRRKRTIDFIEESKYLADLYLDEVYARRAVEIYHEILSDDEIYDALIWIEFATERRADPYSPPEKHDLGWALKNHRSFTSLRELKELPEDD